MKLVNKGEILSDSVDDIYDIIFREYTHKGFCDVDFEGVKAITTKFAGKLFGRLYDNLGKEEFYKNIHIINMSNDVKISYEVGLIRYIKYYKVWGN